MGWSGGTDVFDVMAAELEEQSWCWTREYNHCEFMEPLLALVAVLDDLDWDNHSESQYWDHPIIGKILGNNFEEVD